MLKRKKMSLAVVISMMTRLKESEKKDSLLVEIADLLICSGVCSEQEFEAIEQRFEEFVKLVSTKVENGLTYNDAYKKASKKFPEFKINLN
jgi:hypothetical protein